MKDFTVEIILQPQGKCKYNGRRYISMKMSANDEIEAGNFVKEAIGKCKKRSKSKVTYINEVVDNESSIVNTPPDLIPTQLTSTNKKFQIISKVDENHYVVKKGGHVQVMLTKNIPNLKYLQLA